METSKMRSSVLSLRKSLVPPPATPPEVKLCDSLSHFIVSSNRLEFCYPKIKSTSAKNSNHIKYYPSHIVLSFLFYLKFVRIVC